MMSKVPVRLLLSLCLLAACFVLTLPSPAEAYLPGPGCSCEYYSDAGYQNLVGERTLDCAGNVVDPTWGQRTPRARCVCDPCGA
ncbi:MAG TPA: DUF6289 family protein [Thermoanaerobaculia bacterium]